MPIPGLLLLQKELNFSPIVDEIVSYSSLMKANPGQPEEYRSSPGTVSLPANIPEICYIYIYISCADISLCLCTDHSRLLALLIT